MKEIAIFKLSSVEKYLDGSVYAVIEECHYVLAIKS